MQTVHWLGAGLSSKSGIRRLAKKGYPMQLWNRNLLKAQRALGDDYSNVDIKTFSLDDLYASVKVGDIVVSMLPPSMHVDIARLCLEKKCNFISSSYESEEMTLLGAEAAQRKLTFINEVGLDPGLDHMFAHMLVNEYKKSGCFDINNQHFFRSYCGGFPKDDCPFKYKFSWSPLGVLMALRSSCSWIEGGVINENAHAWKALKKITFNESDEFFEVYPNRNSLQYLNEYGFEGNWRMCEFVRGTMRLGGWAEAWKKVLEEVENAFCSGNMQKISDLANFLSIDNSYKPDEADRVVLNVELDVKDSDGHPLWNKSLHLDEIGNGNDSAMSRLVSVPVSLAVEDIILKKFSVGLFKAPVSEAQVNNWFHTLGGIGINVKSSQRKINYERNFYGSCS